MNPIEALHQLHEAYGNNRPFTTSSIRTRHPDIYRALPGLLTVGEGNEEKIGKPSQIGIQLSRLARNELPVGRSKFTLVSPANQPTYGDPAIFQFVQL